MASTPAYDSVKNDHACQGDMSPASPHVLDGGEVGVLDLQAQGVYYYIARKDRPLLIMVVTMVMVMMTMI